MTEEEKAKNRAASVGVLRMIARKIEEVPGCDWTIDMTNDLEEGAPTDSGYKTFTHVATNYTITVRIPAEKK
tara:strand:- start:1507 stop:1722 length:216 start_codon:yes stop_codon:yes gene_type:complete